MAEPLWTDDRIIQSVYDLTYATESAEVLRAVREMMYEMRDEYDVRIAELEAQLAKGDPNMRDTHFDDADGNPPTFDPDE